jgi:hypothetical protein
MGVQQTQNPLQRCDVVLVELLKLRGVDIEYSHHPFALRERQSDLATGTGVAGDVSRELLDVRNDHRLPRAGTVETDAMALQNLAGDRPLVRTDVELILTGD